MSEAKLKRRLREAQNTWRKDTKNPDIEGLPGYMPGVLKGFEETLRIVRDFQKQELKKTTVERRMLTRFSAVYLYRACRQAYGRLKQSDREGAIRALKRALDKTKS